MSLRAEIAVDVSRLSCLEDGSSDFAILADSGVPTDSLLRFVREGRKKKALGAARPSKARFESDLELLLDLGGHVTGGMAVSRIFGRPCGSDVDVFMPGFVPWVKGVIATFDNLLLDVCLFKSAPYELFDLTAPRCSYGRSGIDVSPECERTFSTGLLSVVPECVYDPVLTAGRIVKYAARTGLRMRQDEALFFCSMFSVPPALTGAIMSSV